jgi:hypothetical protein
MKAEARRCVRLCNMCVHTLPHAVNAVVAPQPQGLVPLGLPLPKDGTLAATLQFDVLFQVHAVAAQCRDLLAQRSDVFNATPMAALSAVQAAHVIRTARHVQAFTRMVNVVAQLCVDAVLVDGVSSSSSSSDADSTGSDSSDYGSPSSSSSSDGKSRRRRRRQKRKEKRDRKKREEAQKKAAKTGVPPPGPPHPPAQPLPLIASMAEAAAAAAAPAPPMPQPSGAAAMQHPLGTVVATGSNMPQVPPVAAALSSLYDSNPRPGQPMAPVLAQSAPQPHASSHAAPASPSRVAQPPAAPGHPVSHPPAASHHAQRPLAGGMYTQPHPYASPTPVTSAPPPATAPIAAVPPAPYAGLPASAAAPQQPYRPPPSSAAAVMDAATFPLHSINAITGVAMSNYAFPTS